MLKKQEYMFFFLQIQSIMHKKLLSVRENENVFVLLGLKSVFSEEKKGTNFELCFFSKNICQNLALFFLRKKKNLKFIVFPVIFSYFMLFFS